MFQKNIFLLLFLPCWFVQIKAQETPDLENQFEDFYRASSNYQEYKVVKRADLIEFKNNVLDTVSTYRQVVTQLQSEIESQQIENNILKNQYQESESALTIVQNERDSFSVLGLQLNKTVYNLIVWGLIGILIIVLLIYVFKFKNSNAVTQDALQKLKETEDEFTSYKQRSLEREQKLQRKLLDEQKKKE